MKRFLVIVFVVPFLVFFLPYHAFSQSGAPNPPPVPTPPPDTQFDYVKIDIGGVGDVDQIDFGTPGKDKIVQYGGTGNTTQYAEGSEGDDWILQVGGDGYLTRPPSWVMGMIQCINMEVRATLLNMLKVPQGTRPLFKWGELATIPWKSLEAQDLLRSSNTGARVPTS